MTRRPATALAALLLGLLCLAAGTPVALLVELEPTGAAGENTAMSVTVQVAPEDRSRIGRDVWVQGELLVRGERVDLLARALDLDDRGQARFEAAWPPGDYELRIEIKGTTRGVTGAWVGSVTVPKVGRDASTNEPAPAEPIEDEAAAAETAVDTEPAEVTTTPTAAAPEVASDERPDAGPAQSSPTSTMVAATAAGAATATLTGADESASDDVVTGKVHEASARAAEPTAEPSPAEAELGEAAPPEAVEPVTRPIPEPLPAEPESPEPAPEVAGPAPQPIPEAPPAEAEPGVAAPEPVERSAEAALEPPAAPTVAGTVASAWITRGDMNADVTVVVTEQNRPILGLGASAFSLRVGRTDVPLDVVGDVSSAPLNLGLVVQLAAASGDLAAEMSRQLGAFALRTRTGGGLLVVTPTRAAPEWGATADDVARSVAGARGGDQQSLATLVSDALNAFRGRRGRSFLVVVTNGDDDSDRAAWKAAIADAEEAGVPVFAVGLRDSGFDDRARSSLAKIADITGGRSYFLGNAGMAEMTLDYVGDLIDGSYALPFRQPDGPAEVKVEVANRAWDVAYPRRVP